MNIKPPSLNNWTAPATLLKQDKTQTASKSTAPEHVKSAQETATDSQEEIGSLHEHRHEAHSKFNHKNLGRPQANQHRAIQHIAQLQHLFQLLHSPVPRQQRDKLRQVKDTLQQGASQSQDSLAALMTISQNDAVLADTLLQLVIGEKMLAGASTGDSDIAHAETLRHSLQQQHGDQIAAGRNTASAIAQFSQDASMKQIMRQLYYGTVIDYQSPGHVFDTLMEKFGGDSFNTALHTLQRALADDIAALSPSMTPGALHKVMHGLKLLGSIKGIISDSSKLMDAVQQRKPDSALTRDQLARKMLHLAQNGVYANDVNQLTQQAVGHEARSQSWFLNGLLRLMNTLPTPLWRDDKSQQDGLSLMRSLTSQYAHWEKKQLLNNAG